jgi:DnaJ-class molecular chaperone
MIEEVKKDAKPLTEDELWGKPPCENCAGKGWIDFEYPCPRCNATGRLGTPGREKP